MVLSKNWRRAILSCALIATAVKIFLALHSSGTIDVFAFREFLANIREAGGIGAYYRTGRAGNSFNHPPFMIHAIRCMGFLADATHLPFRFWLRLPSILADLGSLFLVWKIGERVPALKMSPRALLLLAVYPGSIWISGFHGNTDPLMIFFVILSLYLLSGRSSSSGGGWLAGAAYGMALNIKIVPLIYAPAIFLFLPDLRTRARYFAAAASVFLVGSLPYIAQDPFVVWKTVFGYKSQYGRWGWTQLAVGAFPHASPPLNANQSPTGLHALAATVGRYFMLASVIAASVWMNVRRQGRPPIFLQCGFVTLLFIFLTPGFGSQYLAWLVPWAIVPAAAWGASLYYCVSACYLTLFYLSISHATRSFLGRAQLLPGSFYFVAGTACWLTVLAALVSYTRLLRNYTDADEPEAELRSAR